MCIQFSFSGTLDIYQAALDIYHYKWQDLVQTQVENPKFEYPLLAHIVYIRTFLFIYSDLLGLEDLDLELRLGKMGDVIM